jgi:dTDP-4-amino-4,6-dideoxygalactose transaminase
MKSLVASALRWRDLLLAPARWAMLGDAACERFAALFAQGLGLRADQVWLFGGGRCALHAFVDSLDLPAGSEVLLPGYTCVVVPHVFLHSGLQIRYVDIEADGFNVSAESIASAIGSLTRVVLLAHNFGIGMDGITALRERFPQVVFIEDAAHAWGGRDAKGRVLGTLGQASFFSFEYSKPLSAGLGGALVINDEALRARFGARTRALKRPSMSQILRQLLTLSWHRLGATLPAAGLELLQALLRAPSRMLGLVAKTSNAEVQGEARPDYAISLHPLSAAVGLPQLQRTAALWTLRQTQARHYDEILAGSSRFIVPQRESGDVLLRYPLRLSQPGERDKVLAELASLGLVGGTWFDDVVHPRGSGGHRYVHGQCPNGDAAADAVLNLPLGLHANLSDHQIRGLRAMAQQQVPR